VRSVRFERQVAQLVHDQQLWLGEMQQLVACIPDIPIITLPQSGDAQLKAGGAPQIIKHCPQKHPRSRCEIGLYLWQHLEGRHNPFWLIGSMTQPKLSHPTFQLTNGNNEKTADCADRAQLVKNPLIRLV
jgi:hypothetical protein